MLGFIKSVGSKAISSIPGFSSKTKLTTPTDPNLQQKLNQISSQILKSQPCQQFKVYQQLQSAQNADFNRNLRKIYQHQECTTETINAIIRFYTFLLTNCKNQLVVCKLVSEPLVIELTKIVLQVEKSSQWGVEEVLESGEQRISVKPEEPQQINQYPLPQPNQQQSIKIPYPINSRSHTSLHYLNQIDWDEVNAYKVALIRSYINCINPQTIKYMIMDKELPIFVNCVNGYKNYLSSGVEGTCLSNCILMILTKVNHNDEVCEIVFDEEHHSRAFIANRVSEVNMNQKPEKLTKSISNEKSIKLHIFVKQVINKISLQLSKVLDTLQKQLLNSPTDNLLNSPTDNLLNSPTVNLLNSPTVNLAQLTLKPFRKLQTSMEFIESNILFCVDLINSINNYNYTTKIKNNIGQAIETQLIGKIVRFIVGNQQYKGAENHQHKEVRNQQYKDAGKKEGKEAENHQHKEMGNQQYKDAGKKEGKEVGNKQYKKQQEKGEIKEVIKKESQNKQAPFHLTLVKLIKFVLNLSIVCQKQSMMIQFLNKQSPLILQKLITLNQNLFPTTQDSHSTLKPIATFQYSKQSLTYMCDFSLILLKQTISPYSRLASRKRLEISRQVLQLKENILSKIFVLLEQLTKVQELKENVCYKCVRNLLLCVFYLTIKEDRCALSSPSKVTASSLVPAQKPLIISPQKQPLNQTPNLGLLLEFKYSILVLHKIFSQQFKQTFSQNKHWQFIVNNYQSLMREVPNSILSPQQSDKHCHYHNGHIYQEEDRLRDRIMVCEAVRNYRYMIIHETKLEERLIRLENIYHKHFMSPGWAYYPGQTIHFANPEDFKIVCVGLLHNNSQQKLPMYLFLVQLYREILQDFQCLLISHKLSQHSYKLIANIRYKKIHSFVPQQKNIIRMKLFGIQELILEFSSPKVLNTFKEYLNENRNKTREKQLKFISYYLNMYLKDTTRLIEEIYDQELVGLEEGEGGNRRQETNGSHQNTQRIQGNSGNSGKKLSFDNIEVESFSMIEKDLIPKHNRDGTQSPIKQNSNSNEQVQSKVIQQQQVKPEDPMPTQATESDQI